MHLVWEVPPIPLRAVEVTCTVVEPPSVPELYFFALQVSFFDAGRRTGGAHLGLQHHPRYPGGGAVNWGGYHDAGGELAGPLMIPSTLANPNTGDYRWRPGVGYRLRVEPAPDRGWRGSITDTDTGIRTIVRDLDGGGDALGAPMVWSEVFAPCDAPPVTVRWSSPAVESETGGRFEISRARTNYQLVSDGGCSNGSSEQSADGIVQVTATPRTVPGGHVLSFRAAST